MTRLSPMCRRFGAIVVSVGLLVSMTGCSNPAESIPITKKHDSTATATDSGPGSIVEATPMTDVDPSVGDLGGRSVRVKYRSTSGITGNPTEVTGAVFIPPGKAPKGGWPILGFAHGTVGINADCSPSATPDLLRSIGIVSTFVGLGYAVVAPDYEGLGGPGAHPYLDAKTGAFNLIDSVRALRRISPDVGKRWGAVGGSQGGAVSWAADEQSADYAPELTLVGAVALAPLADVAGYARKAAERTLTEHQIGVYVWLLTSLERTRPGFPIDDFRHGLAAEHWAALSACNYAAQYERNKILSELGPDDLVPSSPEAEHLLTSILQSMALPMKRGNAPMLVLFGGRDTYIDADWLRLALLRACALGTRVTAVYQPDRDHDDMDPAGFSGWLLARFEGLPAQTTCPSDTAHPAAR